MKSPLTSLHKPPFSLSSSSFSHHIFSLSQPLTISLNTFKMSSSSKTLMDFFAQSNSKRRKTTNNATTLQHVTPSVLANSNDGVNPCDDSSILSADEKSRMELKKSIALSKRNLRICCKKVQNSKGLSLLFSSFLIFFL